MSYSIRIKKSAARELARISARDRSRIVHAIDDLKEHPLSGSPLKGELRGIRRIRVGDYRVLYEIGSKELTILVVRVAGRGNVYRRR